MSGVVPGGDGRPWMGTFEGKLHVIESKANTLDKCQAAGGTFKPYHCADVQQESLDLNSGVCVRARAHDSA